jgi:hypothetical protein
MNAHVAKLSRSKVLADMKRRPGGVAAVAVVRSMPPAERANMLELIADLRTQPTSAQRLAVAYMAGALASRLGDRS